MTRSIEFLEEAEKDMKKLGHSAQIQVLKGITPLYNFLKNKITHKALSHV